MTDRQIRHATPEDAEGIAAIYRPIVESTTISFEEVAPDASEIRKRIKAVTQRYPWFVAHEPGGAVARYAYASEHRARAGYRWSAEVTVYVDTAHRGAGVGRALYAALFAELRERGFHRAFAGIALPNDTSIALHRAFAFEKIGEFREVGKKFGRWIDVSWWQRGIAEGRPPDP